MSEIWVYSLVGILSGVAPNHFATLKKGHWSRVSVKKVYFTDTAHTFSVWPSSVLFPVLNHNQC